MCVGRAWGDVAGVSAAASDVGGRVAVSSLAHDHAIEASVAVTMIARRVVRGGAGVMAG